MYAASFEISDKRTYIPLTVTFPHLYGNLSCRPDPFDRIKCFFFVSFGP